MMPNLLKTACRVPLCPHLTDPGQSYCVEHKAQHAKRIDAQRGTAAERGYGHKWAGYSRRRLRAHPLCVKCEHQATLTDHIIPVKGPGDPLFWDESNHQSLCAKCHGVKTATEDGGFGHYG